MTSHKKLTKKTTYFGVTALILAVISILSLGSFFISSQLNVSMNAFNFLSNVTLLSSCSAAPLALIFGVIGYRKNTDSKLYATIAIVLVSLPFLILFVQFVLYFIP